MVNGVTSGQTLNYGQLNPGGVQQAPDPLPPGPVGGGSLGNVTRAPQLDAFMTSVRAVMADITPHGDVAAGAGASEEQAEHLQSLVSSAVSGDTATYLARAMLKFYSEQRHEAVLDRQTLGLEAQSDLMSSAAQLDKEADKMMTGAIVSLVTTCVASAITIGTSAISAGMKAGSLGKEIKSMKNEMSAEKKLEEATSGLDKVAEMKEDGYTGLARVQSLADTAVSKAKVELTAAKMETKRAGYLGIGGEAFGQIGHATAQMISAAGEFTSKMTDAEVKHMEADSKRMDAMAEGFRTQADAKKAIVDALDDMIHQILSFVKDMADAKADRMRSIVRG